jgi:predicted nuclease of predicted toxin-antitoxin system
LRFKLDENIDPRLASLFAQAGHDAETVLGEALLGATDDAIFQACQNEARCLVTLDLDFSNPLRFSPLRTSGIIVLRPVRPILPLLQVIVKSLLIALNTRSAQGKLWIVEPGRIREYEPEPPSGDEPATSS